MGKWTLEPVGDERKIQKEVMFQELEWCEPDKLRFLDLKEIVWMKRMHTWTRLRGAE